MLTKWELHAVMKDGRTADDKKLAALDYVIEKFSIPNFDSIHTELKKFLRSHFFNRYFSYWNSCSRGDGYFCQKHGEWLDGQIELPEIFLQFLPGTSSGRPRKLFTDCSMSTKRRKTEEIRTSFSTDELSHATAMKLRFDGDEAAAKLVTECTDTTPTRSQKIFNKWKMESKNQTHMTPEEAIALFISENLSKKSYKAIREAALRLSHDLYPCYYRLLEAKKKFYPSQIIITSTKSEVLMQSILNKTTESIVKSLRIEPEHESFISTCKWGFDGSSGYSSYKYISQNQIEEGTSSVFLTSFVPIKLSTQSTNKTIWKNPSPSSSQYCRPIKIEWIRETREVSLREETYMNNQIRNLQQYSSDIGPVRFQMDLTMIDGKICNAISNSSSMRCYICGATSSQLNNIDKIRTYISNPENYRFGLSPLHAYIRFFECLLHISYRLDLKCWKVAAKDKDKFTSREKIVQEGFLTRAN